VKQGSMAIIDEVTKLRKSMTYYIPGAKKRKPLSSRELGGKVCGQSYRAPSRSNLCC
jgi:hypothetical protein